MDIGSSSSSLREPVPKLREPIVQGACIDTLYFCFKQSGCELLTDPDLAKHE